MLTTPLSPHFPEPRSLRATQQGREVVSPAPAETTAHGGYIICQRHPGGKQQSYMQIRDFSFKARLLSLSTCATYRPTPGWGEGEGRGKGEGKEV